jgi:Inhibitor of the KinA pathway to sporulation, predicted exonuclease
MNYIVFDLEFNMFFKFKEGDKANPDLKNEIIQIGAVKLNEKLERVDEFNFLIKPKIYKRINPFVKKKINIDTSQIVRRRSFIEVIESFNSWLGNESVLCSWGQDDILGMRDNCLFFNYKDLSFDRFINIQQVYMNYQGLTKQPSLESAVEDLEIEKDSPFHDALSDASYTSDVFRKIYNFSEDVIINWEEKQRENEELIRELKTRLNDEKIQCPKCGEFLPKTREVIKTKKYFAFGYCTECKIQVRHVSRITLRDSKYEIISKNTVYEKDHELEHEQH